MRPMTSAEGDGQAVPRAYKVWVFGSKIAGVLVFAVGLEMVIRASPLWAAVLLVAGAALVLAPVRGPEAWQRFQRTGGS